MNEFPPQFGLPPMEPTQGAQVVITFVPIGGDEGTLTVQFQPVDLGWVRTTQLCLKALEVAVQKALAEVEATARPPRIMLADRLPRN